MDNTIKDLNSKEQNLAVLRNITNERVALRILEWDIIEVSNITPTEETVEEANNVFRREAITVVGGLSDESRSNQNRVIDKNDIASREEQNIRQDALNKAAAGVIAAAGDALRSAKNKNCLVEMTKIKLRIKAARYSDFNSAIEKATLDPNNKSRSIIINKVLTVSATMAAAIKSLEDDGLTSEYFVTFESNVFTDFDLDPNKHALLVNARGKGDAANAQIIRYGENIRDTILGGEERSLQKRGDLKTVQSDAASTISGAVQDYKARIKKSKVVKEIEESIKQKKRIITNGDTAMSMTSADPDKEEPKITPGKDRVSIGNGLTSLKFSKWYKNNSRKTQEGLAPFDKEYKGWKPNILGKWFGSDNVTNVPTWKRNLSIIGDELIKLASAAVALKIFQETMEKTGIEDRLKDFKQKSLDRQVQQDKNGVYKDPGQKIDFNGTDIKNDIDRFIRK